MSGPAGGSRVPLSRVVARLERAGLLRTAPRTDPVLGGVADDSRRVEPGDLFCAWSGTAVDSHDFVPAAATAGAVAVLVERRLDPVTLPQVVVTDGRRAAAVAAATVLGDPADALRTVGVTGTNGKTTTVAILRHLLASRGPAATIGTLGVTGPGGEVLPGGDALTTPGPVALVRTLADLRGRGIVSVAIEASSHALEQGRVASVGFDAAVFTNVSRDHLDYHGTLEAYIAAKERLVDRLRPGGAAVVNADDPAWSGVRERASRLLLFSVAAEAAGTDLRAEAVETGAFGSRFVLVHGDDRLAVELPLLGGFNVQNALGAALACLALDFSLEEVARELGRVPQIPGRLERIADTPCPVLRDYAHTPDALQRALSTLKPLVNGRLIVVFGAGGDRDAGKRPLMGAVVERWADLPIVTSDNPRTEDPDRIVADIEAGMRGDGHERVVDRRQAIRRALELAKPEDLVLLAGKGHETYQVIGTEKVDFDERQVVVGLLAERDRGAA